jgi:LmbE family N-acetylglucosaminyl deacetylase
MFHFTFGSATQTVERVLCLGAHCDDIEIGCGGTLLRLIATYPRLHVDWVVFSSTPERAAEATASAAAFLQNVGSQRVLVLDFRDTLFPYQGLAIKEHFERLKLECTPDLIFTHYRQDLHQDHRVVNELTWNAFRNHLILEYEIPKYDGDLGQPNVFVHLDEGLVQTKLAYLLRHFRSQENKYWFTEETFRALLRLRGIESRAPHHYAEAFYGRKLVI